MNKKPPSEMTQSEIIAELQDLFGQLVDAQDAAEEAQDRVDGLIAKVGQLIDHLN